MKKLIVLALVLGLVTSAFAVPLDEDFETMALGDWLNPDGTDLAVPAGWTNAGGWYQTWSGGEAVGYVENKAFSGPDYSNALELAAGDHANGTIRWDGSDIYASEVMEFSFDLKLSGAHPTEIWPGNRLPAVFTIFTITGPVPAQYSSCPKHCLSR